MQTKKKGGMSQLGILVAIPVLASVAIRLFRRSASRRAFKMRHGLMSN